MSTPTFAQIQRERAEIRDHIERVTGCGRDVASRIATWLHDTGMRGDPTKALLAADPASFAVVQGVGRRSIETIRIFRERARPPKPNDDRALALEALTSTGDPPSEALIAYLRRVHDGTDRGELKALLVEAWGASPASTSDLRGLAARESAPIRESATGAPCICKPGWGHRSDGPHPRERVNGCDTNRGVRL